jgi:uncharacterized protein (TIGR02172 family)
MEISTTADGDSYVVGLKGRLDADSARLLDKEWLPDGVRHMNVDLSQCDYVSSAGLRIFMRLQRECKAKNVDLVLLGVSPTVYEVFDLTGLNKLLDVRRKAREISIEGLEFLSAGVCGQVFRLDKETIVKLYNEGVAAEVAEQEKQFARAAFVAGVPTALSYDIVTCGNRTGVIYEMLEAVQLSAVIRQTPESVATHAALLADVAHTFHSKQADAQIFPDLKARLRVNIAALKGIFSDADVGLLAALLEAIPDADNLVHFDLHTSNIMLREGEPVIIDMGDVSRGHYLFDVGLVSMIYGYEASDSCEFVTKIPNALGRRLYEHFIDAYFARRSSEERAFFEQNEAFLASLRLINAIAFLPLAKDELVKKIGEVFLPLIRQQADI